jgi:hypothetical protein
VKKSFENNEALNKQVHQTLAENQYLDHMLQEKTLELQQISHDMVDQ